MEIFLYFCDHSKNSKFKDHTFDADLVVRNVPGLGRLWFILACTPYPLSLRVFAAKICKGLKAQITATVHSNMTTVLTDMSELDL